MTEKDRERGRGSKEDRKGRNGSRVLYPESYMFHVHKKY